jgi:hypothetical protein
MIGQTRRPFECRPSSRMARISLISPTPSLRDDDDDGTPFFYTRLDDLYFA